MGTAQLHASSRDLQAGWAQGDVLILIWSGNGGVPISSHSAARTLQLL